MEKPSKNENVSTKIEELNSMADTSNSTPLKSGNTDIQYGGVTDDKQLLVPPACKKVTFFSYLKTLTIEPVLFSFIFAYIMEASCLTNLMMDKGCRFHLNYSDEVCDHMANHTNEKSEVEILANDYSLYSNLMNLIGAVSMIFIAPWSDRYGRKLPLALACFGIIIGDICILWCVINFESKLFYLILAKIPGEIFGGFICIMTIVFSHASEVSTEEKRTQKYTTVEIAMGFGMSVGGSAGGALYRYYGYFYVYLTATIIHFFCLFWAMLFVQETRGLDVTASWSEKGKDLFRIENLVKGFKAATRSREYHGRAMLFLFFLSMCVIVLTYESFGSIGFTYVHHIYDWDPLTYSSVTTIFGLSQMVTLMICIPILLRLFNLKDYALGIIGTVSFIGKYSIIAFANFGVYIYYIGNAFGNLGGITTLTLRAGISKIIEKDEIGTIFSFLATCESILPMVGTVLLTKVFNATINVKPSVIYLMVAVVLLVPLGTFILYSRRRRMLEKKASIQ